MSKYLVTCKECNAKRKIAIIKSDGRELIDWLDNNPNPQAVKIVSGRKRLDGNWGWSCICKNDDIMTDQEKNIIENYQEPSPQNIVDVINNLKTQKPKFNMEKI